MADIQLDTEGNPSTPSKHQRLSGVESGEVGSPCRLVAIVQNVEKVPRLLQMRARSVEAIGDFRAHRSNPSNRTSFMKTVRSRYAPAGKIRPFMTAPVSYRMFVPISAIRSASRQ